MATALGAPAAADHLADPATSVKLLHLTEVAGRLGPMAGAL
ncbi:MAG: hypothetical protein U5K30_01520 [Acidimicrobiales bacterium]|nr:hypothetical protein [Acidimicrobiales bacterium]